MLYKKIIDIYEVETVPRMVMSEVEAIMASLQLGSGTVIQSLPPELLLESE